MTDSGFWICELVSGRPPFIFHGHLPASVANGILARTMPGPVQGAEIHTLGAEGRIAPGAAADELYASLSSRLTRYAQAHDIVGDFPPTLRPSVTDRAYVLTGMTGDRWRAWQGDHPPSDDGGDDDVGVDDAVLRAVGARRRLDRREEERAIVRAALAGYTQTRTAELLGVSQPHVGRTLAAVRRRHDGQLVTEAESPSAIIDRRDAGYLSTEMMMVLLAAVEYTEGAVVDIAGHPTDAYVRGSWDEIEAAFHRGRLSFEQYETLFQHRRMSTDQDHQTGDSW